jgi:hypothetical protein
VKCGLIRFPVEGYSNKKDPMGHPEKGKLHLKVTQGEVMI